MHCVVAYEAIQNSRWVSVDGLVLAVRVSEEQDENGKHYCPDVGYRYTVNERTYESRTFALIAPGYRHRESAEAAAARYRVGQQVTVYHDPRDPSVAVLQKSFTWELLAFGFICWVLAGITWLFPTRRDMAIPQGPPYAERES